MARTLRGQIAKVERAIEKKLKVKKAKSAKESEKKKLKSLRDRLSKMK